MVFGTYGKFALSKLSYWVLGFPIYELLLGLAIVFRFNLTAQAQDQEVPVSQNADYRCIYGASAQSIKISLKKPDSKLLKKVAMSETELNTLQKRLSKKLKRARGSKFMQLKKMNKVARKLLKLIKTCPSITPNTPGDNSATVFQILEANCRSCHQTWDISQQGLIAGGLVRPRDLENSRLYAFLNGNPEGYAPGYMPKGLPALRMESIQLIREWIMHLPVEVSPAPTPTPISFACNSAVTPSASPLKRLSTTEYRNTVTDLLRPLSSLGAEYTTIWSTITEQLNMVPEDQVTVPFLAEREFNVLANDVSQSRADSWYRIAAAFAAAVTQNSARRSAFSEVSCDPGQSGASSTCITNWINRFGLKTFRRPLTPAERTSYVQYFQSRAPQTAMSDLIMTMLLSPQFLFHFELGGTPDPQNSEILHLSPYEIASRLSYTFWQTMPDDQLFTEAANNAFSNEQSYRQIVDRVFNDTESERTKTTIDNFWTQYLHLDFIPPANPNNSPSFNAATVGLGIEPSDARLAQDLRDEIYRLIHYYTWDNQGNYDQLLTSSLSFAQSPELAAIYGIATWVGPGNQPIALPNSRGLLARAGLLFTGSEASKPISRASRFKREFLCQPVEPPSEDVANQVRPPALDPTLSTRERFHRITQNAPCAGCHVGMNPFGWVFERYDGLGRERTVETIYNGSTLLAQHAVNSTADVQMLPGYSAQFSDSNTMVQAALSFGQPQACLARQAFRYYHRRRESDSDNCVLEAMRQTLVTEGGSLREFFKAVALSPHFRENHLNR